MTNDAELQRKIKVLPRPRPDQKVSPHCGWMELPDGRYPGCRRSIKLRHLKREICCAAGMRYNISKLSQEPVGSPLRSRRIIPATSITSMQFGCRNAMTFAEDWRNRESDAPYTIPFRFIFRRPIAILAT